MLDPWIIEEIRKREQDERRRREQPHIPLYDEPPPERDPRDPAPEQPEDDPDRGVVIIPISPQDE